MFIQVRKGSKYFVTALWKETKGFAATIEESGGKHYEIYFSDVTGKFYKDRENAKIAKYLCKALLDMAISKGIIFMSEIERENALYWAGYQE
jgi:hypothetical protein